MIDREPPYRHPTVMLALVALIALTMFGAGVAWQTFFRSFGVEQPLSITACDPDTYGQVEPGERGPAQADCEPVDPPDGWPASQPITVAGQVCNNGRDDVSYTVSVAWRSVDVPGLLTQVINVPITYEPGCQPPYLFEFTFPEELAQASNAEPGESLGRWRIVGRAEPVDRERFAVYQWDAVKTVELVAD